MLEITGWQWGQEAAYLILNAYWEPLDFELPPMVGVSPRPWRRWIDTSLESPHDIVPWDTASSVPDQTYRAGARSVAVLFGSSANREPDYPSKLVRGILSPRPAMERTLSGSGSSSRRSEAA